MIHKILAMIVFLVSVATGGLAASKTSRAAASSHLSTRPLTFQVGETQTPTLTSTNTVAPTTTVTSTLVTEPSNATSTESSTNTAKNARADLPEGCNLKEVGDENNPGLDMENFNEEVKVFARRYMVSEAEIVYWRCQGYGFGEVAQAFMISNYANVPVDEVFAKRAYGWGWGNIKQFYGLIGNNHQNNEQIKENNHGKSHAKNPEKNNGNRGGNSSKRQNDKHGKKP